MKGKTGKAKLAPSTVIELVEAETFGVDCQYRCNSAASYKGPGGRNDNYLIWDEISRIYGPLGSTQQAYQVAGMIDCTGLMGEMFFHFV